ncbi:MAG: PEP-CTERM sorting domain-containing protein [Rubrivivax sp.]|nr:PEP-CTERM sorting domain-containing protein [Rubrivivax sp.]
MKLHRLPWAIDACALLATLAAPASAVTITPAVEFNLADANVINFDPNPWTFGYEFTLSATVTVNALGYFNDGFGQDHQVAIWSDVGGSPLVSATVLGTDPVTGNFRYQAVTEITLAAGTYRIGGEYLGDGEPLPIPVSVTRIAGLTWNGAYYRGGAGLNFPFTSGGSSYGNNGVMAPTFSVSNVPEPSTTTLALVGVALFGLLARRKAAAARA